jgi:hypothetical protein
MQQLMMHSHSGIHSSKIPQVTLWLPVVGYEGKYEVSDDGRVRSLDRLARIRGGAYRPVSGREMKIQFRPPRGYPVVTLGHDHKVYVHTLMLTAFAGPCPPGQEALHENDVAADNRWPENLSWGTRSQNKLDAVRNGKHNNSTKTHCKRNHEFTPENTYINATSGGRQCRQCQRDNMRRFKAKQKSSL